MEQQQTDWQAFWDKYLVNRYGKERVQTEDDLYFQVARTVNKKPVEKPVFDRIIAQIKNDLSLSPNDVLADFCCGNGLFTFELKDYVKQIIGIDFSEKIIETANEFKSAPNIIYYVGYVTEFLKTFSESLPGVRPNKYLMNDSLAYFTPAELEAMLSDIMAISSEFTFLIRGVPDERLKWNYYNTDERRQVYFSNIAKGDYSNGGLGNWWNADDIAEICNKLQLKFTIKQQDLEVSDYRMDVTISRNK